VVTTDAGLLAAIATAPEDTQARLVYADWLLANGDERGELIAFDDADRRGHFERFTDDPALHRLLVLSARYGFPRFPGDPDDALLVFEPVGRQREMGWPDGEERRCALGDRVFIIGRVDRALYAELDSPEPGHRLFYPHGSDYFRPDVALSEREVEVFTSIVSRALRLGRWLEEVDMPYYEAIAELDRAWPERPDQSHPLFGVVDYERWGRLWQRWFRRP
jgi:uncharacterized protein (TIGR02996 family)